MENMIRKIFLKKVIFKIFVVLVFFFSLFCMGRNVMHWENPYGYGTAYYDNFIQFVDNEIGHDFLIEFKRTLLDPDAYNKHELNKIVYIRQAMEKGIITISKNKYDNMDNEYTFLYTHEPAILRKTYKCIPNKLDEFMLKYEQETGVHFWGADNLTENKVFVNCTKAKTVRLEMEEDYFWKYDFLPMFVTCFVYVPAILFVLWLVFRIVILGPILWILRKD